MIKIHNMEQLSEEWFALRCGSLGGSRVKDAMAGGQGKSRKTLAYQLAAESVTGAKTEIRVTPAMQWGVDTEDEAREYFEFVENLEVQQVGLVVNDKYPGCHASPDGLIGGDSGIEIKCPQPATHAKNLDTGKMPPEYKAQVQYTMMICGLETYYFMSYHPAFARQLILKVYLDPEYTAGMEIKIALFMGELEGIKKKIGW